MNTLYYGDNLDILRRYVKDETVDLIYLDPPFKSNQDYNVLFAERDGSRSAAQIKAFEDTWCWDQSAARAFQEVVEAGGRVSRAMQAFRQFLGDSDMLAYLAMMAPRLVELRRVLKPTGSIYLHCDPTASHYLKMLMDAVFSPQNFRNEIIWKRTFAHSSAKRYGPVHDVILFYARSDSYTWNKRYQPYDPEYLEEFFDHVDADGRRWMRMDLTGDGTRRGDSGETWKGIDVTAKGRHWAIPTEAVEEYKLSPTASSQDKLEALDAAKAIHWPQRKGGVPRLKRYVDKSLGVPLQTVWNDIRPIHNLSSERLGYPTQKPEPLLERIISASSNEGDVVLDPFCGCGTAVVVAERLKRQWIGIDITHLAIGLVRHRLKDAFGDKAKFEVVGEPVSLPDARELAKNDPYQFQWWALGLVEARPVDHKKGADHGIDGRHYFHDDEGGATKQIILSVKSGGVSVKDVRDLRGVIEREKAEIGVFITLEEPTKPMQSEAASAGFYKTPYGNFPRLQILTIEKLLEGRRIDYPPEHARVNVTFKKAPKARTSSRQLPLSPAD